MYNPRPTPKANIQNIPSPSSSEQLKRWVEALPMSKPGQGGLGGRMNMWYMNTIRKSFKQIESRTGNGYPPISVTAAALTSSSPNFLVA